MGLAKQRVLLQYSPYSGIMMADHGKVSELQAEVAQAQSEINAANKRPTRAAKARAQDALGGAAQATAGGSWKLCMDSYAES